MTNLHTPERLPGESFDKYRERRVASRRAARLGMKLARHAASANRRARRAAVKAVGIRQYKRQQYRARGWL
jgi:hypothetical protein